MQLPLGPNHVSTDTFKMSHISIKHIIFKNSDQVMFKRICFATETISKAVNVNLVQIDTLLYILTYVAKTKVADQTARMRMGLKTSLYCSDYKPD